MFVRSFVIIMSQQSCIFYVVITLQSCGEAAWFKMFPALTHSIPKDLSSSRLGSVSQCVGQTELVLPDLLSSPSESREVSTYRS